MYPSNFLLIELGQKPINKYKKLRNSIYKKIKKNILISCGSASHMLHEALKSHENLRLYHRTKGNKIYCE